MHVLVAQLSGVVAFLVVTLVVGSLLRRRPQQHLAETTSRISHLAYWLALVAPWLAGFVVPGPRALDSLVGLRGLPLPFSVRVIAGGALLAIGVWLMQASVNGLKREGSGAPAFKLTRTVVGVGIYGTVRNPMSLGYYLACVGGAVLAGSTYILLYTVLGVIPVHLFNLKFFEELELSIRYGESYERYRQSTPFLVPRLKHS